MIHPNPSILYDIARLRHQESLKQAEQARLAEEAAGQQPSLFDRVNQSLNLFNRPAKSRAQSSTYPAASN